MKLGTSRPSNQEALRRAVDLVLADDRYAAAAGRVRAEMAEHDAGREGADLLERLPARTMELLR